MHCQRRHRYLPLPLPEGQFEIWCCQLASVKAACGGRRLAQPSCNFIICCCIAMTAVCWTDGSEVNNRLPLVSGTRVFTNLFAHSANE
jgi:hypothetical protein